MAGYESYISNISEVRKYIDFCLFLRISFLFPILTRCQLHFCEKKYLLVMTLTFWRLWTWICMRGKYVIRCVTFFKTCHIIIIIFVVADYIKYICQLLPLTIYIYSFPHYFTNYFKNLTYSVKCQLSLSCGRKPEKPGETYYFRQSVNGSLAHQYIPRTPIHPSHTNTSLAHRYIPRTPIHPSHTNTSLAHQYILAHLIHPPSTNTYPLQLYRFSLNRTVNLTCAPCNICTTILTIYNSVSHASAVTNMKLA